MLYNVWPPRDRAAVPKEAIVEFVQLTDDIIANLNDEQLMILQELGELAAKKFKITSAIDEFTEQVATSQKTMGFQTKETPEALHEDPEVLSLVTIKARYKITNVNKQIERTLKRAVAVGLGHLALVQRQCRIYGVDCSSGS